MTNEKLIAEWNQTERAGLVRLRAEDEEENYFDIYGLPTGYHNIKGEWVAPEEAYEEMVHTLELYGSYRVVSQYFDGEKWQCAGSIGMCTGYHNPLSPEENCYVPQLMRSALAHIPQQGEH